MDALPSGQQKAVMSEALLPKTQEQGVELKKIQPFGTTFGTALFGQGWLDAADASSKSFSITQPGIVSCGYQNEAVQKHDFVFEFVQDEQGKR